MRRDSRLAKLVSLALIAALVAQLDVPFIARAVELDQLGSIAVAGTQPDGEKSADGLTAPDGEHAPEEDGANVAAGDSNALPPTSLDEEAGSDAGMSLLSVGRAVDAAATIGDAEYATLQAAIAAAKSGETVTLQKDTVECVTVPVGANLTLDLNGYTLSNKNVDSAHTITNQGALTIKDSSEKKSGTVQVTTNQSRAAVYNDVNATLTIEDGTYERPSSSSNFSYVIANYGSTTINDGVFRSNYTSGSYKAAIVANGWENGANPASGEPAHPSDYKATLVINGGDFTGGSQVILNNDYGVCTITDGTFTQSITSSTTIANYNELYITGGNFIGPSSGPMELITVLANGTDMNKGTTVIEGGNFTTQTGLITYQGKKADSAPDPQITGGTFTSQDQDGLNSEVAKYLPAGYELDPTTGEVWSSDSAVAQIEGADGVTKSYKSLADAVKDLKAGDTLTLLTDVSNNDFSSAVSISLPAGVTLEGGGHTLSGNICVYVNAAGGTVQNVNFKDIHNADSQLSALYAQGLTGTLTITGCTFDTCDWDAIQTTPKAGAVLSITGNIFRNSGEAGINTHRYVHVQSARRTDFSITATDNKFYDIDKLQETAFEVYYPTEENKVNLSGNFFDGVPSVCVIMNSYDDRYDLVMPLTDETLTQEVWPAATLSDSYNHYFYSTLADAIDAAGDDEMTITLQRDIDGEEVTVAEGQQITIDPNGKKLNATIINNGLLEFYGDIDAASSYTLVNNGTLSVTKGETYDASKISGGGTTTITGGTFTAQPDASMLPEWYVATALDDDTGRYKVSKMTLEQALAAGAVASSASSGNIYYASLDEAFQSVANGSVYLQTNADEDVSVNLRPNARYSKFHTNGFNLTGNLNLISTYSGSSTTWLDLYADQGGSINLEGIKYNGQKINVYDGPVEFGSVEAAEVFLGTYNRVSELTIKDGKVGTATVAAAGALNIEGGTYGALNVNVYYTDGETEPTRTGRLSITGGTFSSNEITLNYANHPEDVETSTAPLSDYVPEGYEVVDNGDGTYTVQAKSPIVDVDGTSFVTLQDALATLKDGSVITLLKDVEIENNTYGGLWISGSNLTLDLNGHTIKTTTADGGSYQALGFSGTNNTVKNGTIEAHHANGGFASYAFTFNCGGTFENVKTIGGVAVYGTDTIVTIKGDKTDITATNYYCIYTEGYGPTANIEGGTFRATSGSAQSVLCAGVTDNGKTSTINVTGGTFEGKLALDDNPGIITVSGGSFSEVVDAELCANGYVPTTEKDANTGRYAVVPGPSFYGRTLTLDGRVGVNFYVDMEGVENPEQYTMHFTVNDTTTEAPFKDSETNTFGEKIYYRFTCPVDAKQMTDVVEAQLYKDGVPVSKTYTYSVKAYADRMMGSSSSDQSLVDLLTAMLNYGGYAQVEFGYKTDNLAYAGLDQEEIDAVKSVEIPNSYQAVFSQGELPEGLSAAGMTLLLESEVSIRLYVTLEDGHTIGEYAFWVDGEQKTPVKCTEVNANGSYYIELGGIQANRLGTAHEFSIERMGSEEPTWSMQYSALTYAYNKVNDAKATESLKNLVRALYSYSQAADAFSGWVN